MVKKKNTGNENIELTVKWKYWTYCKIHDINVEGITIQVDIKHPRWSLEQKIELFLLIGQFWCYVKDVVLRLQGAVPVLWNSNHNSETTCTGTANHFFESFKLKKYNGRRVILLRQRKVGGNHVVHLRGNLLKFTICQKWVFISIFILNPDI